MERDVPSNNDPLGILRNMANRLDKLEAENADIRKQLAEARERQGVDLDFAKVNHVMQKFFPHDSPEAEPEAAPVPKFDQYTGEPLH